MQEIIESRYRHSIPPIQHTLSRLKQEGAFLKLVEELRSEGWRDWHILQSVVAIALNYRAKLDPEYGSNPVEVLRQYGSKQRDPEPMTPPVPLENFTEDAIREIRPINMMTTLQRLGLDCRQVAPDFSAIEELLAVRYRYWDDDVPHDDPFC